jgi:hypothetical protein
MTGRIEAGQHIKAWVKPLLRSERETGTAISASSRLFERGQKRQADIQLMLEVADSFYTLNGGPPLSTLVARLSRSDWQILLEALALARTDLWGLTVEGPL